MGLELLNKGSINVCIHRCRNVFYLDAYVADAQHDISAETLNAKESALFKLMVQSEQLSASSVKVPRIFEQMKADQIAEKERLEDLVPIREHLEDVRRREGRMQEEADVRIQILSSH